MINGPMNEKYILTNRWSCTIKRQQSRYKTPSKNEVQALVKHTS